MSSVIFNGSKVKALKKAIQLANQATIYSDALDPSSVGFAAALGDMFISTTTNLTYKKTSSGDTGWTPAAQATAGDISVTSFTAADNQASPANVTGFAFANASITSFDATVSVVRGSTYEQFKLYAIQKAASWDMRDERGGDISGLDFSITNAGQIQYTSTSTGSGATIKFRAIIT